MRVQEHGAQFVTGEPVTFPVTHNTDKAEYFGSRFQQDIEPAGMYVLHVARDQQARLPKGWIAGTATIESPLVVAFNSVPGEVYGPTSWKAHLWNQFRASGSELSEALRKEGYDGIVTVTIDENGDAIDTREIVLLPPVAWEDA